MTESTDTRQLRRRARVPHAHLPYVHAHYPSDVRGGDASPGVITVYVDDNRAAAYSAAFPRELGDYEASETPRADRRNAFANALQAYLRNAQITERAPGAYASRASAAWAARQAVTSPHTRGAGEVLSRTLGDLLQQFVMGATAYTANFVLAQRVAAVEEQLRLLAGTSLTAPRGAEQARPLAAPLEVPNASAMPVGELLAGLEALAPRISEAFARAFGARPSVTLSVLSGEAVDWDGAGGPTRVRLEVDATAADPDAMVAARERGARADFVGSLTELLSAEVLERLTVVYRFPRR